MDKNKENELRRLQSMAESLYYGCDDLMGFMQIENGHGFDVKPEDEEAFIVIGELHEVMDEYRNKLQDVLNNLKK